LPDFEADDQMSKVVGLRDLMKSCLAFDVEERPDANQCLSDIVWMPSSLPSRRKADSPSPRVLYQLGHTCRLRDDFKEAQSSFTKAMTTGDDAATKARSLVALGEIARVQGQTDTSRRHLDQAAKLYASIKNELGQANVLVELGNIHLARSQYDEAAASFTRAREIYAKLGDDKGQLPPPSSRGLPKQNDDNFLQVAESYIGARATYAHTGDDLGGANALAGLGEVHYARGQYAEAETTQKQAESVYARIGNNLGRANALRGL
ncbi:hypothetical protein FRC01_014250, partial [Tulasnella sp. 417]